MVSLLYCMLCAEVIVVLITSYYPQMTEIGASSNDGAEQVRLDFANADLKAHAGGGAGGGRNYCARGRRRYGA
jgi:hypothetical protein